ncbi:MAG TPA: glycosyltransferase family 39 protein [Candidatus Hydrogenedentes bacterium]|nr:glycosyltransferase family 39 protein [Candidatus Hydrogenedentota bacterium]
MEQDTVARVPEAVARLRRARAGRWAARLALALVLALALWVRLSGLDRPFWDDEIYTVYDASVPVSSILNSTATPLYYLITKGMLLLGQGEALLRMPSVLAGLAGVLALFAATARLAGPAAGLAAALFMALSTYHVFVSQEARFYAVVVFFGLAALCGLIRLCERPSVGAAALLTLGAAGAMLTHLSAVFFVPPLLAAAFAAVVLRRGGRPLFRSAALAALPLVAVAGLALVPFLLSPDRLHSLAVVVGLGPAPDPAKAPQLAQTWHLSAREFFLDYLRRVFLSANTPVEAAVVLVLGVLGLGRTARRRPLVALFFLCVLVAVPLALTWMPARHKWAHRYFVFLLPVLMLLVAAGLPALHGMVRRLLFGSPRAGRVCAGALACAGIFVVAGAQARELGISQASLPVTDLRAAARFASPHTKMGAGRHLYCYLDFDKSPSGGTHIAVPFQYYLRREAPGAFVPLVRRVEGMEGLRKLRCEFPDTHLWVVNCNGENAEAFAGLCHFTMPWSPNRWPDLDFGVIAPETVNFVEGGGFENPDTMPARAGNVALSGRFEAWRGIHALTLSKEHGGYRQRCEAAFSVSRPGAAEDAPVLDPATPHVLSLMLRYHVERFGPKHNDGVRVLLQTMDGKGAVRRHELFRGRYYSPWRRLVFPLRPGANLPPDVRECAVVIALENASGTVWADDVQVEAKPAATFFTNGARPGPECP